MRFTSDIIRSCDRWYSDEGAMKRLMGAITIGQMRFNATPSIDRVADTAAKSAFL